MRHDIPAAMAARMADLEARDAADRLDGTAHLARLRQVPRVTGEFLALLCAAAPPGPAIEIGTSAGYSAMWLALACRESARRLTTYEVLAEKVELARETIDLAGIEDVVEIVHGDFRDDAARWHGVGFCFLDAEKDVYEDCYDLVVGAMAPGGLLVCDNVISHATVLEPFVTRVLADQRVDAVVVPIGKGELVARRR